MVEPDLAELVDQHRGVAQRRIGQQPLQQRRLAGTQEARDQVDRREHHESDPISASSSGSHGRPMSFSAAIHRCARLSTISVLPVAVWVR